MRRLRKWKRILIAECAVWLIAAGAAWGLEDPPPPSEMLALQKAWQLCRERKLDEAVEFVRAQAQEQPPPPDIALAMYSVGMRLHRAERDKDALALFQEVTVRFPDSAGAALAWCGAGQVFGSRGERDRMLAALERGTARMPTREEASFNFDGTLDFACETLWRHYLASCQWQQGHDLLTHWSPNSWCGTCWESMEQGRENGIILCRAQLSKRREAAEQAWASVARPSVGENELIPYLLVRLYEESGQREDLQKLARELNDLAQQQWGMNPATAQRLQTIQHKTSSIATAIALIDEARWSVRLAVFRDAAVPEEERSRRVQRHVVAWLAIRDPRKSVPLIRDAVDGDDDQSSRLAEVLAAMATPAARKALVDLALTGPERRQSMVSDVIRTRFEGDRAMIASLEAREAHPRRDNLIRETQSGRIATPFYQPFPPGQPGELPKTLPAAILGDAKP